MQDVQLAMLPPSLKGGSSPVKQRLCLNHTRLPSSDTPLTGVVVPYHLSARTYRWQRWCSWESQLDPEHETLIRRQIRRARGQDRDAVRRIHKWDVPAPLVALWGTRHASHWSGSRSRWEQFSEETQKKQEELDAEGVRRRFQPASSLDTSTQSKSNKQYESQTQTSKSWNIPSTKPFVTVSSHSVRASQKTGEKPIIETSSWNSTTFETKHSRYDPISNRMVPVDVIQEAPLRPDQTSSTTQSDSSKLFASGATHVKQHQSTSAKLATLPKDDIDFLTSDNVRASMGKTKQPQKQNYKTTEAEVAALEHDFNAKSDMVSKDIEETRRALKRMRRRERWSALAKMESVQAKESGVIQPSLARLHTRRHEQDRSAWNEITIRLYELDRILSTEMSADGTPSLFTITAHQDIQALKKRLTQLLEDVDAPKIAERSRDFENHLEKARGDILREVTQLENAYDIGGKATSSTDIHDGYSTKPLGMQTSFAQESEEALEEEIELKRQQSEALQKGLPQESDDGYDHKPKGMQTSYAKEREQSSLDGKTPLEKELDPAVRAKLGLEFDDGYSKAPIGLETSFAKEQEECASGKKESLDHELHPHVAQAIGLNADDGYSRAATGLETSFIKEREECASGRKISLEEEINAKLREKASQESDDGYTKAPLGLEKSFAQEREEALRGRIQSLEKELAAAREAIADANRGLTQQNDDGYSETPVGLETSFIKERGECLNGQQEPLEKELIAKQNRSTKAYDDHYSQAPIGLQILYQQEVEASKNGKNTLLEDETTSKRSNAADRLLKDEIDAQKRAMLAYEGRYNIKPHTVKSSTASNTPGNASENGTRTIQAEGDVCPNVTKYASSDKWYKQTNEQRAEAKMIEQAAKDRALVQELDAICKRNGLSVSAESQLEKSNECQVRKSLEQHDKKLGCEAYKFKEDGLEKELKVKMTAAASQTKDSVVAPGTDKSLRTSSAPELLLPSSVKSSVEWAEPALYKVVAYDSGNDIITTVTTTSKFSDSEGPLSVTQALTQLYQPARFVPSFSKLQSDGYQVISASKDLLVFRKVKNEALDESLDPVNPVDGASRPPQVPTGNFASPTGFVNFDMPTAAPPPPKDQHTPAEYSEPDYEEGVDWRHYPRVRRQEAVFSGARRYRYARHEKGSWKEKRGRRWRKRIIFALSVGAWSAGTVYLLGVGAELARGEREKRARESTK